MRKALLNLIFPPRCALCTRFIGGRGQLCPACADAVRSRYWLDGGRPIAGCRDSVAALRYLDQVRSVLIDCKCRSKPTICTWGGGLIAACLLRRMPDWQPDLITYAPTTFSHWWKRGFHLAHALAKHAAAYSGVPCVRTIHRSWFGRSQVVLHGVGSRRSNADLTFRPVRGVDLTGKRVVLVDDVAATGATAASCAEILRRMGADEVFFLCLAQTPSSAKKVTKNVGKPPAES